MAKIAVVGVGYVGLCTSAGFASLGHEVRSFDVNVDKIAALNNGEIPIFEPGLEDLVLTARSNGSITFLDELEPVIVGAEYVFVCVPTPQDEDGAADLSYVLAAAKSLAPLLDAGATVVVKSTVPVGAADRVIRILNRTDVNYVSNPEFLREGSAMWDFFNPDRIVVGSENHEAAQAVASLYQQADVPTVVTTAISAELIKYAANAFLAMKLSFVNEVAAICERAGADVRDVAQGFGLDSRVGAKFLSPGPGWGGSCFPKDTRALLSISEQLGVPSTMVQAAVTSNEKALHHTVERLVRELGEGVEGCTIAAWGIAFKANTDDVRESPAVAVIRRLAQRGAKVIAYDPIAILPEISGAIQVAAAADATIGADALIVLTEWDEFSQLDAEQIVGDMSRSVVYDTRGVLGDEWSKYAHLIRVGQ